MSAALERDDDDILAAAARMQATVARIEAKDAAKTKPPAPKPKAKRQRTKKADATRSSEARPVEPMSDMALKKNLEEAIAVEVSQRDRSCPRAASGKGGAGHEATGVVA